MKHLLLRIPGLVILALFIQTSGIAQQDGNQDSDNDSPRKYDEITIRHKSGKDAKVTIEIKDGDVLVDGKPISDFEDSTLSIHRRKIIHYGNVYGFTSPDVAPKLSMAFQNMDMDNGAGWSYSGDNVFRSSRAMLGVVTEPNEGGNGVKITQAPGKGTAAEKMGLKAGDVITKVDEEEIDGPRALSKVIGGHDAGDKVTITFVRDGKAQKATGELGKAKPIAFEPMNMNNLQMPEMKELPQVAWPKEFRQYFPNSLKFGIRAQDAEDGKGVKVLDVDDESTAAKAGIKEGDVITRFDGKDINSVTALTEAARAAKEKMSVKVTIVRDGKTQEIDIKVPRVLRTADL